MSIIPISSVYAPFYRNSKIPSKHIPTPALTENSDSFYKHVEGIKSYNLAFLGARLNVDDLKKPVYIIDAYQNYKKFDNADVAAEDLKLKRSQIIKCAYGDREYIGNGYISAFADSVEEFNGRPDKFLINLASEALASLEIKNAPNLNSVIISTTKQEISQGEIPTLKEIPPEDYKRLRSDQLNNPFYVMNGNFEYGKYFSKAHVARHIGVTTSSVMKGVVGSNKLVNGYAMAPASKIETEDKNGKILLNLDILTERFNKQDYFYAIDKNGKYYTFSDTKEASKKTKADQGDIVRCLLGQQNMAHGYVFAKRNAVEIIRPNGSVKIDKNTLKLLSERLLEGGIYIIDPKTKECKRYNNSTEAAEAIETDRRNVTNCACGQSKTVKGKIAVYASEIETKASEGIQQEKVDKLIEAALNIDRRDYSKEGFYAIKRDFCEKFYFIEDAGKILKADPSTISLCLKKRGHTAGGYVFCLPEEIEIKDENGKVEIDKAKLEEKLSVLEKGALYAIKQGVCKRYESETAAEKDTGISASRISECIRGRKKTAAGMVFIPADRVEKRNANGEIDIDEKVLQDAICELRKYETYAFYADGSFEKFPDRMSAARKLGIDVNIVRHCANKGSRYENIIFVPAKDIEIMNEDWSVMLDTKRLNEALKPFTEKATDYPVQIIVDTLLLHLALIQKPEIG